MKGMILTPVLCEPTIYTGITYLPVNQNVMYFFNVPAQFFQLFVVKYFIKNVHFNDKKVQFMGKTSFFFLFLDRNTR